MESNTIKSLAKQMSLSFEARTRMDGGKYRSLKLGSPEWMHCVCREAHNMGGMLPDDIRYSFIEDSVDAIADCEEGEEDEAYQYIDASIYTHELTGWLHSRVDRIEWMDEASSEFGPFLNITSHLQAAQKMEMDEVFFQVLEAFRNMVESQEEDSDDA